MKARKGLVMKGWHFQGIKRVIFLESVDGPTPVGEEMIWRDEVGIQ